jgi:hypothetical protein
MTGYEQATELEFLKWFFYNADFGPAHSDVLEQMLENFKEETGKALPDGYDND